MSENWKPCAICGDDGQVGAYLTVAADSVDQEGLLLRCARCGLAYVDEPVHENVTFKADPTEDLESSWARQFPDRLDTYAKDAWGSTFQDADGVIDWQYRTVRELVGERLEQPGCAVLELGAARGYLMAKVAEHHPEARLIAVEPSPVMAEIAAKSGATVHNGVIDDADLEPSSLDAVVGFGCFIQVRDPRAALETIHRALKPGGKLLIDSPNDDSLFRAVIRMGSRHRRAVDALKLGSRLDFAARRAYNPRRFYYYTRKTFSRLLAQTGFEVTSAHYRQTRYVTYGRESLPLVIRIGMRALSLAERLTGKQSWVEVRAVKTDRDS